MYTRSKVAKHEHLYCPLDIRCPEFTNMLERGPRLAGRTRSGPTADTDAVPELEQNRYGIRQPGTAGQWRETRRPAPGPEMSASSVLNGQPSSSAMTEDHRYPGDRASRTATAHNHDLRLAYSASDLLPDYPDMRVALGHPWGRGRRQNGGSRVKNSETLLTKRDLPRPGGRNNRIPAIFAGHRSGPALLRTGKRIPTASLRR